MGAPSTGSRAIISTSLLVALELFSAVERLLQDIQSDATLAETLGVSPVFLEDVKSGVVQVTMDDVTHWIATVAINRKIPSLRRYLSLSSAAQVVSSLELLIRTNT